MRNALAIFFHLCKNIFMAENFNTPPVDISRKEKYELLLPQIQALVQGEPDLIANLANIMAALKYGLNFFWVGIYFIENNELVLGPFQGPVACVRISYGKGVCGTAWAKGETITVADVEKFPGHIACNAESKSEIVVPVLKQNCVIGVLDVDSNTYADFDDTDVHYLNKITALIATLL
jgi:GAF domain-containing protein